MFSGSDEFNIRAILDNVEHIRDLYMVLNEICVELQYSNSLKEFELGIIDNNEFNQRRNNHYAAIQQAYENNR